MKDRPSAIVLHVQDNDGADVVTVLPITHTPPAKWEEALAIEIPPGTKRRLGLDEARSWVLMSEANRFTWPGPDLRMAQNNDPASAVFGLLPDDLFERIRKTFLAALKTQHAALVSRTQ